MPRKRIVHLSIISIIMVTLFLLGIFSIPSLFPLSNQTSIPPNTSLPSPTLNSTYYDTNMPASPPKPEPKSSFTGAIIVGITRPVTILGAEGFSSSNISIKAGDSITWKNEDQQRKRVVLIFQQGREQNKFFSSPALWPGEEWEHAFWEEGEYNYWTTQYGVEGKVVVTPCKNRFCPRKR